MRFEVAFALLASLTFARTATPADARFDDGAQNVIKSVANDYLAMDYKGAAAQLDQALRTCGASRCAPATRAALWRDYGTMQFRSGDESLAMKSFSAALALKPNLDLNPDYDASDLRALWTEARSAASAHTDVVDSGGDKEGSVRGASRAGEKGEVAPSAKPPDDDEPEFTRQDAAPLVGSSPRFWLGAAATIDFMAPPSGDNLCRLDPNTARPANTANIYCVSTDGSDFPSRSDGGAQNGALTPGQAGHSSGNVVAGGVRLMVALDVTVNPNWLVGLRIGGVFGTYPGREAQRDGVAPGLGFDVEGRVSWVPGNHPLSRAGLAPIVFVGAGASEFDEHMSSSVAVKAYRDASGRTHRAEPNRAVDLWITNGPAFVVAGGGLRYAPLRRVVLTAVVRAAESLGSNGLIPAVGPEVTVQYGLW